MPTHNNSPSQELSGRGRPRSAEVHSRILDTTLELLAEAGFEKLSIEMIARRSGVGKSSIYRRWSNKDELVVDALERLKPVMPAPGEGSIREVIFNLASSFAHNMDNPLGRQMLSLLISTLSGNTQISDSYWQKHSLPKTRELGTLLEQYRQRDSLKAGVNLETVSEMVLSFVMFQLLLKPSPTNLDADLRTAIDIILKGIQQQ
ncbi:TetR/AcrR family transcriptional regulator [Paenibacillus sp. S150]|uniref:TetR/AcrR family transcriptional regulator n=1 Tax=Paenibacillus sp. S150 TaxID=2749826 RepID=UPI001C58031C|nr:TetR/AcrR family transcriptional regulator [Paenibacillus sp. S150]MBW4084497.1 TetR/AcrR family transcriptional regulator [Paenibacillus sp. S150]